MVRDRGARSRVYLGHISAARLIEFEWYETEVRDLGYISAQSRAYLGEISAPSLAHLGHVSTIHRSYLGTISVISRRDLPQVDAVAPSAAPLDGGTLVTVRGNNLDRYGVKLIMVDEGCAPRLLLPAISLGNFARRFPRRYESSVYARSRLLTHVSYPR